MNEARPEVQALGLTRQDVMAVTTQAIIDMRSGGMTVQEGMVMCACLDAQTRRTQVTLNAVKLMMQCKAAGEDFGQLLKIAKQLQETGEPDPV